MNNTQTACERLTQSRDRMRQALGQGVHPVAGSQVRLIAKTAYGVVATMVGNRPWASVVGTALVSALLVRTKAWRWLPVSALLAALAPQLVKVIVPRNKS